MQGFRSKGEKRFLRARRMKEILDRRAAAGEISNLTWLMIEPMPDHSRGWVITVLCALSGKPGLHFLGALEEDPYKAGALAFSALSGLPQGLQESWADQIQLWTVSEASQGLPLSLYRYLAG